jgi:SagB-type dehydrogenase family enzyme
MATAHRPGDAIRMYLDPPPGRQSGVGDWRTAPTRCKRYPLADRVTLPWDGQGTRAPRPADGGLTEAVVAGLLRDLLGVVRVVWSQLTKDGRTADPVPPAVLLGRPVPSGGGLYPVEAYLVAGPPLDAALYHYDSVHHALERVRDGDHRKALAGTLTDPAGPLPHAAIVLTAVPWRSMVKYGHFAYRLICQEVGILIAQAMAVGEPAGLAARAHLAFDDDALDALLGLDPWRESALAVLTLAPSRGAEPAAAAVGEPVGPFAVENRPRPRALAPDNPATVLHRACRGLPLPLPAPPAVALPAAGGRRQVLPRADLRLARGTATRQSPVHGYRPEPVALPVLGGILARAAEPYPGDLAGSDGGLVATVLDVLAFRVAGLAAGAYRYDAGDGSLTEIVSDVPLSAVGGAEGLRPNTRTAMEGVAAVIVPVGDPVAGAPLFGDRWYRFQQAEAGLAMHRATLAAGAASLLSRIHSDGTNAVTDAVLGLAGAPARSLSFLLLGVPRATGPSLARWIPIDRTRRGDADSLTAHDRLPIDH